MPTYSEMTITFTTDAVIGDSIGINVKLNDVVTSKPFTWVATRTGAGEVTTGTPTATAGERTAINLEAAYDLDNPANYITTQTTNELLIQSETLGEDFIGIVFDSSDTIEFTVTYDNYIETPTSANVNAMLVRSPYFINTPFDFDTTTKVTIELYIWDGDITVLPASATRTLTKIRPTIDYAEFNTNISKIVRDEIELTPPYTLASTTQIVDSSSEAVKWVYYNASYTDETTTIADIEGYFASVEGWGEFADGANPTLPDNDCLTNCTYRKVSRDGFVLFPFVNNGDITDIDITTEDNEINATETPVTSNESSEYVQYIMVDVSDATTDSFLTIDVNNSDPSARYQFIYEIVDECRYTPVQIVFKNQYGVFDQLTMFKKRTDTYKVERDDFIGNYISGGTYETTKHQFKTLNVQGKQPVTLNSGYTRESENTLYKELMFSDEIYFYEDGYVPVNIMTKDLEIKTRTNDGLINYTLEFEYAYNIIQNVN